MNYTKISEDKNKDQLTIEKKYYEVWKNKTALQMKTDCFMDSNCFKKVLKFFL